MAQNNQKDIASVFAVVTPVGQNNDDIHCLCLDANYALTGRSDASYEAASSELISPTAHEYQIEEGRNTLSNSDELQNSEGDLAEYNQRTELYGSAMESIPAKEGDNLIAEGVANAQLSNDTNCINLMESPISDKDSLVNVASMKGIAAPLLNTDVPRRDDSAVLAGNTEDLHMCENYSAASTTQKWGTEDLKDSFPISTKGTKAAPLSILIPSAQERYLAVPNSLNMNESSDDNRMEVQNDFSTASVDPYPLPETLWSSNDASPVSAADSASTQVTNNEEDVPSKEKTTPAKSLADEASLESQETEVEADQRGSEVQQKEDITERHNPPNEEMSILMENILCATPGSIHVTEGKHAPNRISQWKNVKRKKTKEDTTSYKYTACTTKGYIRDQSSAATPVGGRTVDRRAAANNTANPVINHTIRDTEPHPINSNGSQKRITRACAGAGTVGMNRAEDGEKIIRHRELEKELNRLCGILSALEELCPLAYPSTTRKWHWNRLKCCQKSENLIGYQTVLEPCEHVPPRKLAPHALAKILDDLEAWFVFNGGKSKSHLDTVVSSRADAKDLYWSDLLWSGLVLPDETPIRPQKNYLLHAYEYAMQMEYQRLHGVTMNPTDEIVMHSTETGIYSYEGVTDPSAFPSIQSNTVGVLNERGDTTGDVNLGGKRILNRNKRIRRLRSRGKQDAEAHKVSEEEEIKTEIQKDVESYSQNSSAHTHSPAATSPPNVRVAAQVKGYRGKWHRTSSDYYGSVPSQTVKKYRKSTENHSIKSSSNLSYTPSDSDERATEEVEDHQRMHEVERNLIGEVGSSNAVGDQQKDIQTVVKDGKADTVRPEWIAEQHEDSFEPRGEPARRSGRTSRPTEKVAEAQRKKEKRNEITLDGWSHNKQSNELKGGHDGQFHTDGNTHLNMVNNFSKQIGEKENNGAVQGAEASTISEYKEMQQSKTKVKIQQQKLNDAMMDEIKSIMDEMDIIMFEAWTLAMPLLFKLRKKCPSNLRLKWNRERTAVGGSFIVTKGIGIDHRFAPTELSCAAFSEAFQLAVGQRQHSYGKLELNSPLVEDDFICDPLEPLNEKGTTMSADTIVDMEKRRLKSLHKSPMFCITWDAQKLCFIVQPNEKASFFDARKASTIHIDEAPLQLPSSTSWNARKLLESFWSASKLKKQICQKWSCAY